MDDLELELKKGFLEEATQLLDEAEQVFLDLEGNRGDPEILNKIFRLAHNLKGTSRAVGFGEIAEFTHKVENLILKLKNGELQVTDQIVSVLLACNDQVRVMVNGLIENIQATFSNDELVVRIEAVSTGQSLDENPSPAAPETEVVAADADMDTEIRPEDLVALTTAESVVTADLLEAPPETPDLTVLNSARDPLAAQTALPETKTPGIEAGSVEEKVAVQEEAQIEEAPVREAPVKAAPAKVQAPAPKIASEAASAATGATTSAAATSHPAESQKVKVEETIRVSTERLEKLNNLVGELVILQSMIRQQSAKAGDVEMHKAVVQLGKLSKDLHGMSMGLRMLPIKGTIQKMQRIVRDTSKVLQKEVDLILYGEETEVDKTVLESLNDPLVHIVRNAVDHGIEMPSDRELAGKNPRGRLEIKCSHEGNQLVIEVLDDGKGIDTQRVKAKAEERGILKPGVPVTEEQLINLIFHPGFSTKAEVSEVSGRGVGMDVVRTNIKALNGDVKVFSQLGKGSRVRIELPLTMAVIEGMIAEVAQARFVLPISQVYETLRPSPKSVHFVTGLGEVLDLRGENLPVIRVSEVLKLRQEKKPISELTAVIVRGQRVSAAIMVDEIVNQQQVVVKKLSQGVANINNFIGSSILGDGLPALILDLQNFAEGNRTKEAQYGT